jgi:hypothetical protein
MNKTLLDEFAMAAMGALLSGPGDYDEPIIAALAYDMAVAMMAERARRKAEEEL